jgi:hypothetical protein
MHPFGRQYADLVMGLPKNHHMVRQYNIDSKLAVNA